MTMLATTLFMVAATVTVASAQPFQWSDRVVVVRAAAESDPLLARQRELLLAERDGLLERDMVAFAIVDELAIIPIFGKAPLIVEAGRLDNGKLAARPFPVTLIGKDGGVKRESDQPINAAEILAY